MIALRHDEQLTNSDVAHLLGLDKSAASKRYMRAINRLGERLAELSGAKGSSWI